MGGVDFGLEVDEGGADALGEGFGGEGLGFFEGDGGGVEDADGVGVGEFLVAGPGFEGAVDEDGDDGDGAFRAAEDESEAGGDGADGAVFGAGAFGEDVDEVALIEALGGGADGGAVGVAAFDGEGVEGFHEPVEEAALEEGVAGHVMELARQGDADEPGIEEGLVVGDKEGGAGARGRWWRPGRGSGRGAWRGGGRGSVRSSIGGAGTRRCLRRGRCRGGRMGGWAWDWGSDLGVEISEDGFQRS